MTNHADARLVSRFLLLAKTTSVVVALLSVLVLIGWALEVETLKSVIPGMVAMNPGGTAVGFLLGATALWLLLKPSVAWRRGVGRAFAGCVVAIAVIRLAGYATGWDNGPDRWLFRQRARTICAAQPHGPQYGGLLPVVRTGAGCFGREMPTQHSCRPNSWRLPAALIALLAIIGYSYSAVSLIGIRSFIPMALNTAVAFALLECRNPAAPPVRRPDGDHQQPRQPAE